MHDAVYYSILAGHLGPNLMGSHHLLGPTNLLPFGVTAAKNSGDKNYVVITTPYGVVR